MGVEQVSLIVASGLPRGHIQCGGGRRQFRDAPIFLGSIVRVARSQWKATDAENRLPAVVRIGGLAIYLIDLGRRRYGTFSLSIAQRIAHHHCL